MAIGPNSRTGWRGRLQSRSVDIEEIRARVAKRIRDLCARRKLSLNQLADRAEVTRSLFYDVLGGKRAATTDTLTKLAIALGVDPMELLRAPRGQAKTKPAKTS